MLIRRCRGRAPGGIRPRWRAPLAHSPRVSATERARPPRPFRPPRPVRGRGLSAHPSLHARSLRTFCADHSKEEPGANQPKMRPVRAQEGRGCHRRAGSAVWGWMVAPRNELRKARGHFITGPKLPKVPIFGYRYRLRGVRLRRRLRDRRAEVRPAGPELPAASGP